MVEHRMHGQHDVGTLRIDKSADIFPDFRIKAIALIRPRAVDHPEIPPHPLWSVRQQRVVETSQDAIDLRGFFDRFANGGDESGGLRCIFNGGRRAVVSFPRIRG